MLGINRYLKSALDVKLPRAFSPIHNLLDRMHRVKDHDEDPDISRRAKDYLEQAVYPVLAHHAEHFPKILIPDNTGDDPNAALKADKT